MIGSEFNIKPVESAPRTMLIVDPSTNEVYIGNDFAVNVTVANVADLFGFEFFLTYNTILLDVSHVVVLPPFGKDPRPIIEIHELEGYVRVASVLKQGSPSLNGSFPLTSIVFNGTSLGSSRLALSKTTLLDPADNPIPHTTVDGSVTVKIDWWPMIHHDLSHTGFSTSTAPRTNSTLWRFTTGPPHGWPDASSPAILNDVLFIGSTDKNIYALNATSGALIWKYATGGAVWSHPAVANGILYAGSADGHLYALNSTTGQLRWIYNGSFWFNGGPAVANGMVYATSDQVYALNALTGTLVWNYSTYVIDSSPAVADGMVFVGSLDGYLYALNAMTGELRWKYASGRIWGSPALADGLVFFGAELGGGALSMSTGEVVWTSPYMYYAITPAVAYGKVFVNPNDGKFYALDELTGAVVWNVTIGPVGYLSRSSPAVADNMVFVGSANGKVYALNATTGVTVWSYQTPDWVTSSPAIANGMVFVGAASRDRHIYAFGVAHNVAVINMTASKTVVGNDCSMSIRAQVANLGYYNETFNITAYANTTAIQTKTLALASGAWTNVTFIWNTTSVAKGNYTISAYAAPVLGEIDAADNTFTDGWAIVAMVGDVAGIGSFPTTLPDGKVDIKDLATIAKCYGANYPDAKYVPNYDLNDDGKIDIKDLALAAKNYGKIDP